MKTIHDIRAVIGSATKRSQQIAPDGGLWTKDDDFPSTRVFVEMELLRLIKDTALSIEGAIFAKYSLILVHP